MPEGFDVTTVQLTQTEDVMAWGIIMALFSVVGMLVLIFAQPQTERSQTFGRKVVNPSDTSIGDAEEIDMRRAA